MEILILIIIGCFLFGAILYAIAANNHEKHVTEMNGIIASSGYNLVSKTEVDSRCTFGVDEEKRKVVLFYRNPTEYRTIDFGDIIGVELLVNGNQVASRSFGSLVGATLVGGIAGAMSVKQTITKKYNDIRVVIRVRSLSNPSYTLKFLDVETEMGEFLVDEARKVVDAVKVIIDTMEKEQAQKQTAAPAAPVQNVYSVADELRKLAQLRQDGIISDSELEEQKRKLLHQE